MKACDALQSGLHAETSILLTPQPTSLQPISFDVSSILHHDLVQPADECVTLRTTRSLQRHVTLTDSKHMSILAPVPMSRTGKVIGHGSHDHPRLEIVFAFSEEATDLTTLTLHAPRLAGVSATQFSGIINVGARKSSDLLVRVATLHDSELQDGQLSPENVAFYLLEDVLG